MLALFEVWRAGTRMIKISQAPPPDKIYKRAQEVFGDNIDFMKGTVFTYGDTIHSLYPLAPDFIAHETVHTEQQIPFEGGPDAWWERYFIDKHFRLSEELAGYRAQYRFICIKVKDRNNRDKFLRTYAIDLSSVLYGNMIGGMEAMKLIKQ